MRRLALPVFLLALALCPARGVAQEQSARELFDAAAEAIGQGRFAEARDLLRQSLAVGPRRATAFNLGVALRGTGEVRDSVVVFDELLRGVYGDLSAERRTQIESLLLEVRADLAHIDVSACGAERVEVRVDGELRATLGPCGQASVEVDPGDHVVRLEAPGAAAIERRVTLAAGQRHTTRETLVVRPTSVASEEGDARLWLWLGLGAGLVAVVAIVVAVMFTLGPPSEPRVTDDVFGEIVALRF